ncbi:MAG: hypothetical protein M0R28_05000 [Pigmentiphaga sp.]|nr:hypothetical protein [Pigmentiphaga sp.]
MTSPTLNLPHYPTIALLLRHGRAIMAVLALLPTLGGLLGLTLGLSLWWLASAVVVSAAAYLLLNAMLELIQILADFVLPR